MKTPLAVITNLLDRLEADGYVKHTYGSSLKAARKALDDLGVPSRAKATKLARELLALLEEGGSEPATKSAPAQAKAKAAPDGPRPPAVAPRPEGGTPRKPRRP